MLGTPAKGLEDHHFQGARKKIALLHTGLLYA